MRCKGMTHPSVGRQVVNLQEARAMEAATVNFFAVNCAVGISLARVPGFSAKVAKGILGALPFAASSLVGVRSEAEAAQARALASIECASDSTPGML